LTLYSFVLEGDVKWPWNRIQVLWDMTLPLRVMVPDQSKERIGFVFEGQEVIKIVRLRLVVNVAHME